MHLRSDSFRPYDFLDPKLAFARYDAGSHLRLSENRNPHLAWSAAPEGTRSFAVLGWDPDVPSKGDDVNQEGRIVPIDLPRVDFFHWVLIDLPPDLREIGEGVQSGVVARGKPLGASPVGGLQGLNDYTGWFAADAQMRGDYAGYDGPCPPWNDERVHGYHFGVFALDVPTLGLEGPFTGQLVRDRMKGHVIAMARIVGLYTLNPAVGTRIAEKLSTAWV